MEQENNQKFSSTMPVLERLDRLDRLLCHMEEKQNLSQKHSSPESVEGELGQQCKPLSSALKEVQFKGTLMERVAMLENRLSLEMEEGHLSRSSSSTVLLTQGVPAKQDKEVSSVEKQDQVIIPEKAIKEACIGKPQSFAKGRKSKRAFSIMRYRKWLQWFQIGC